MYSATNEKTYSGQQKSPSRFQFLTRSLLGSVAGISVAGYVAADGETYAVAEACLSGNAASTK